MLKTQKDLKDVGRAFKVATLFLAEQDRRGKNVERDAEKLIDAAVYGAPFLAILVCDEKLEQLAPFIDLLADTIKKRRLAVKLGNTAGRTPEEAALFEAAAKRLRGD